MTEEPHICATYIPTLNLTFVKYYVQFFPGGSCILLNLFLGGIRAVEAVRFDVNTY